MGSSHEGGPGDFRDEKGQFEKVLYYKRTTNVTDDKMTWNMRPQQCDGFVERTHARNIKPSVRRDGEYGRQGSRRDVQEWKARSGARTPQDGAVRIAMEMILCKMLVPVLENSWRLS